MSSIKFSFNQSQNNYHPSPQEIKKFKANNNELSENFKTKCNEFKNMMDIEINEFKNKYSNEINIKKYPDEIRFYNTNDDYYELTPYYNISNDIIFAGIKFSSSEQLVCFAKAIYSKDLIAAFKILIVSKSYYAHNYAKNISPCLEWDSIYYPIIYISNNYKFKDETLKNKLMETKNKYLIFESKTDNKLGIGKDEKGENVLGIILMMIRDDL